MKISIESTIQGKAELLITDITGKQLIKRTILFNSGNNTFDIKETTGFSRGTYLLRIISEGKKETIKIIKRD